MKYKNSQMNFFHVLTERTVGFMEKKNPGKISYALKLEKDSAIHSGCVPLHPKTYMNNFFLIFFLRYTGLLRSSFVIKSSRTLFMIMQYRYLSYFGF